MLQDCAFLYVEDDAGSREGLNVILRRVMGVNDVWIFEDSTDFLQRVKELPRRPDVFLLDIHMHPYTGFEMLSMLRAEPEYATSKVIALTASVMNEEVDMLRSYGFDGVIGKPINIQAFPNLIERTLNGESIWSITD